jgi:copper chaperone
MAKTYKVNGMSCGGCAASVERAIKATTPGVSVQVDLENGLVTVEGVAEDGVVQQAVEEAGFIYAGPA